MNNLQALRERVEFLEAENENLKNDIRGANSEQSFHLARKLFGTAPLPTKLLFILLSGKVRSKAAILNALYEYRLETPEIKIVDVLVCKLRKQLKPYGVEIVTVWGQGFLIPPEMRQHVLDLLEAGT